MSSSVEYSAFAAVFEKQTLRDGVSGARVLSGYETRGPKEGLLSLSGGKQEPDDNNCFVQTAIRETEEEADLVLTKSEFRYGAVLSTVQSDDKKAVMYIFPCVKESSFVKESTRPQLQLDQLAFRTIPEILQQPHTYSCDALPECYYKITN